MKFHSTNGKAKGYSFEEVLLTGLAPDGGLFMPDRLPKMPRKFFDNLINYSFHEIAKAVSAKFITSIPKAKLSAIIKEAFNFPVPLIELQKDLFLLELFHGPTMAFKDFGARFMARIFSYYLSKRYQKVKIITATSGDTGSAVASGFYQVPNVEVYILYPSGKVSPLQEKQLTTYGGNITALEVKGTFDDCQRLAKAILKMGVRRVKGAMLSSANSINFGRLLPQSFYYFWAYAQLKKNYPLTLPSPPKRGRGGGEGPVIVVPSGNMGNLTAGLIAHKMGLPVSKFLAATNINDTVPHYLTTGRFIANKSKMTISNAMDVGNPSNFARMLEIYRHDFRLMKREIAGRSITDQETRKTISRIYRTCGHILDPHTAVGVAAALKTGLIKPTVVLATAHPAKFREIVEPLLGKKLSIPRQLKMVLNKKKKAIIIRNDLAELKTVLTKV